MYIEKERQREYVICNFPRFCNNFGVVSTKTRPPPKRFTRVFPHTCGVPPISSSQSKLKMKNKKSQTTIILLLLLNYT